MSPEEYERIKAAEKAHLKKLKALKQQARTVGRQKRLLDAIQGLTGGPQQLFDEHQSALDAVQESNALSEARMEVALESAQRRAQQAPTLEDEAALKQNAAADFVQQVKTQMGVPETEQNAPTVEEEKTRAEMPGEAEGPAGLPEKTIGRMKKS